MIGEKIYEYDLDVTGVTDYGVTLQSILSGQSRVPPQGARIDVAFEGQAKGQLTGRVRGVDYLRLRADGRIDLDSRNDSNGGRTPDRPVCRRCGHATRGSADRRP